VIDRQDGFGPLSRKTMSETLPRSLVTRDGRTVTLRPIAPADFDLAKTFTRSLSRGTRYLRFGRHDFVYDDADLRRICEPDPALRDQVVAVTLHEGKETMVGSARYVVQDGGQGCEFAVVVLDGWSGLGLGAQLMRSLMARARQRGLATMAGQVLGSNAGMLEFAQRLGFTVTPESRAEQIKWVRRDLKGA
jgi:acetyltransferase